MDWLSIIGESIIMKIIRSIIFIYLIFLVSCIVNDQQNVDNNTKDEFSLTEYIYSSPNNLEYDLIIRSQYKNLIFKKEDGLFKTDLTLHIKILNENNEIIFSDSWLEIISVPYYENTQSLEQIYIYRTINLIPDKYSINISIDDYANHKQWNIHKLLKIPTEDNINDIALLYKKEKEFQYINENQYLHDIDTIWIKYKVSNSIEDTSSIIIEVNSIKNTIIFEDLPNNSEVSEKIIIPNEEILSNAINMLPLNISEKDVEWIEVNLFYKDIIKSRSIKISNKSNKVYNYENIIGPMEYLLNKDDYFEYDDLDSLSKVAYIEKYWGRKYNSDLLDEFINRVNYSNINFSQFSEGGWESDRGKIYIIYGKPLNITFDFNQNGEFEIWSYKNNKQFIFINSYGIFELYNQYE